MARSATGSRQCIRPEDRTSQLIIINTYLFFLFKSSGFRTLRLRHLYPTDNRFMPVSRPFKKYLLFKFSIIIVISCVESLWRPFPPPIDCCRIAVRYVLASSLRCQMAMDTMKINCGSSDRPMKDNARVHQHVVILGADAPDMDAICRIIEKGTYRTETCPGSNELERMLESDPCRTVILDIDSVPLDNRAIRELTQSYPSTSFLCTSRERFHPDLKDAIRHHLFACLHKPVDPDELHYFLKCIRNNGTESRGPPVESF